MIGLKSKINLAPGYFPEHCEKKKFIKRRNVSVLIKAQVLDKAGSAKVFARCALQLVQKKRLTKKSRTIKLR